MRYGQCPLRVGGYEPYPIQSAVTVTGCRLQILLRMELRAQLRTETDVEVFEVFSCEASEEAKQVVVACDFVTKPTRLRYGFGYT